MDEPKLTDEQAAELAAAIDGRQTWMPSGMRINYGESEDRMRGFNTGYDAYMFGDGPENRDPTSAPDDEPNRSAYLDGWDEGFEFARRQDPEMAVVPPDQLAAVRALIAAGDDAGAALAVIRDDTRSWCDRAELAVRIESVMRRMSAALDHPAIRALSEEAP